MRSLAVWLVAPAMSGVVLPAGVADVIHSGVSGRMRPSQPMIGRVGSCSSRHQVTSVRSPNVQIIAMPEPFSGSASGVRDDGHLHAEAGRRDGGAEQRLVPLVVGVRDQGDAGGEQLRAAWSR